jgi:hypothetical protein
MYFDAVYKLHFDIQACECEWTSYTIDCVWIDCGAIASKLSVAIGHVNSAELMYCTWRNACVCAAFVAGDTNCKFTPGYLRVGAMVLNFISRGPDEI